jgi:hypothetical protein
MPKKSNGTANPEAREARAGNEPAVAGEPTGGFERFSVKRKSSVVIRLLRGEEVETVSRELKVPVHELIEWREAFFRGGQEALKSRPGDPSEKALMDARAKIGELMMKLELYQKKEHILSVRRSSSL